MRKLWPWGLTAVLMAGLTFSSGWAKDEDDDDAGPAKQAPRPAIRWSPYFAGMAAYTDPKPEVKKPAAKPKKESVENATEPTKSKSPVDEAAAERARLESVLMRRLEVCDKLKELALRTNDTELFRRAEVLDERARTAYAQRTASLRGGSGGFVSDEKTVDKYLGPNVPLKTRSPESSAHAVAGNDRASRASIKEENP